MEGEKKIRVRWDVYRQGSNHVGPCNHGEGHDQVCILEDDIGCNMESEF